MPQRDVEDFIKHWSAASASERANSQLFLAGLCELLEVPAPDNHPGNGYFFEYPVMEHHADGSASQGRIDLYKRACFVLESKQFQEAKAAASQLQLAAEEAGVVAKKKSSQPVRGTGAWDDAMTKARGQAERYVRALPDDNPPFIIVVDVGHTFELFADFTQAGKAYLPFPDPRTFRLRLADLADAKIRERLRLVWTNPAALDPAKQSADVTREVSAHLAELAKSLELAGHAPDIVAQFLTRCLFCMFAEDVELLPDHAFTELLHGLPADGTGFTEVMGQLFRELNTGTGKGISVVLRKKLLHFNGGLFADDTVLPVNDLQLGLLKEAARQNWGNVEPAIFGTLLERALNPDERHELGAHFTPRAYVERLVLPTVIEPLRAEWANVRAAAFTHGARSSAKLARAQELTASSNDKKQAGDIAAAKVDFRIAQDEEKSAKAELAEARAVVNAFHAKLCSLRVLDPACGTGNFLYVSLQQLKVLEGEVLDVAAQFGEDYFTHTIDPHQFLGLEINPRAAAIAELVLWIGYLQWHFKLHGKRTPREPILRAFKNIECRDALLCWSSTEPLRYDNGEVVTRWDGKTLKRHPITGEHTPDEGARVDVLSYVNPQKSDWPSADYVVGNPPFIGNKLMREVLGDGYVEALRREYCDVPDSVDYVMYWWHKAARGVKAGTMCRFGFITRNSITQKFNRAVVAAECGTDSLRLAYAIPNHPWVDSDNGAQVRIALTVADASPIHEGILEQVTNESPQEDGEVLVSLVSARGIINADLSLGINPLQMVPLRANIGLACPGVQLSGQGFVLSVTELHKFSTNTKNELIRRYLTGYDLMQHRREQYVIDTMDLSHDVLRDQFSDIYQHLADHVRDGRATKSAKTKDLQDYAKKWWRMSKPRSEFRKALLGLRRFIVSSRTSRHRVFQFCGPDYLPETKVLIAALEEPWQLGVLSSRIHVVYATRRGGWHGVGNDPTYNHTECFDPFPFPHVTPELVTRIGTIAETLDDHRKERQRMFPSIALTDVYNVLAKLRAGTPLDSGEKEIHDHGLVSVLKQLHDDLDDAVFAAYGWPATLTDAEILERLVALNAERAAEEKRGIIHWLRPEYQNRGGTSRNLLSQEALAATARPKKKNKARDDARPTGRKSTWPKSLAERVQAVEAALHAAAAPVTPAELAQQFARAKPAAVAEILQTLATLGRAHRQTDKFTR